MSDGWHPPSEWARGWALTMSVITPRRSRARGWGLTLNKFFNAIEKYLINNLEGRNCEKVVSVRKHKGEHESGILVPRPRTNPSRNSFKPGLT